MQKGIVTDPDLQLIMNKMNIKVHINCSDPEKYVRVFSTMIDAKLEVNEADYQKFYRARKTMNSIILLANFTMGRRQLKRSIRCQARLPDSTRQRKGRSKLVLHPDRHCVMLCSGKN